MSRNERRPTLDSTSKVRQYGKKAIKRRTTEWPVSTQFIFLLAIFLAKKSDSASFGLSFFPIGPTPSTKGTSFEALVRDEDPLQHFIVVRGHQPCDVCDAAERAAPESAKKNCNAKKAASELFAAAFLLPTGPFLLSCGGGGGVPPVDA